MRLRGEMLGWGGWLGLLLSTPGVAASPPAVIVAPVVSEAFSDRIEALGTAQANEAVDITANVTEKVVTLNFDDGEQVAAGAVLAVLEKSEEEALLADVSALLEERRLALARLQKLERQQLASREDLDQRRLEVERAEVARTAMQARIADRVIRAPFGGMVGLRQISVGALVEPGDLITRLDDIRTLKLDFTVPSRYLADLRPGLPISAQTSAFADMTVSGEVASIDSRIDPVTRAIRVRARIDNPNLVLRPGLLMRVVLERNPRTALTIPEEALLGSGVEHRVMVVDAQQQVAMRQVQIGSRRPGRVEILSGLAVDERVITHGQQKARVGGKVTIRNLDDGTQPLADMLRKPGA
ncbi:efflux RND transporter periplasmic adaptor subunit [Motiliproteus sediminis]|uniref:efflux RND transporter periplasmic adaptor subunit n=1 Tax=Motiliproteus sediminis TaxID=1468178 RepID=UPI001AEFD5AE|nr:efflux RND transporter periplasmic adaptor subunit [Motiliproteus sediminis]